MQLEIVLFVLVLKRVNYSCSTTSSSPLNIHITAGKVEETPKKCKDLIHHARALLDDVKFAQFGESPREEVMTLERILLQTMNFDLQVDHSYSYLLK